MKYEDFSKDGREVVNDVMVYCPLISLIVIYIYHWLQDQGDQKHYMVFILQPMCPFFLEKIYGLWKDEKLLKYQIQKSLKNFYFSKKHEKTKKNEKFDEKAFFM